MISLFKNIFFIASLFLMLSFKNKGINTINKIGFLEDGLYDKIYKYN